MATAWLTAHPSFRMATDADCECADDIRTMRTTGYGGRWKAVPDYHPYVVSGDFNDDGAADFAIAVVDRSRSTKKFTLLVFNGPLDSGKAEPAFVEKNADLTRTAFFYGPPRPKPYRLVIGEFESEGMLLIPKGRTYRYVPQSNVNE